MFLKINVDTFRAIIQYIHCKVLGRMVAEVIESICKTYGGCGCKKSMNETYL
jgi:hypothetical protein